MSASEDRPLSTVRAWAVVLVATATMAISYLDRQVLSVLSEAVGEDLEISDQEYGWLASAFSIAYLVCAPLAGRLIERVGVRRGLLGAVVLWTIVSALHAVAPTFGVLFAMRLALGIAEAPSFPGSAATIARVLPAHRRSAGMGVLFTGSSLGAILAPKLAIGLAGWLGGWRAAFVGVALIGSLWVPLWIAVTSGRDVRRALETARGPTERASLLSTLRNPAVLRAVALVLAISPMFAFVLLWNTKLLVRAFALGQNELANYLLVPLVLFDLGSVAFGVLAMRYSKRSPIVLAAIAFVIALSIALGPLCADPWQLTIVLGVAMVGGGGLLGMLTADMIRRVGPALAATAGGITAAAQSLAYIAANPLIGRGVETWGSYDPVMVLLALWMIPGALVWLLTPRAGQVAEQSTDR